MSFDPQALGRLGITEEQVELMDVAENFCRDKTYPDKRYWWKISTNLT